MKKPDKFDNWSFSKLKDYIDDRLYDLGVDNENIHNSHYFFKEFEKPGRYYHTLDHVIDLVFQLENIGLLDNDILFLSAVYHDCIYDPKSFTNEDDSAKFFLNQFVNSSIVSKEIIESVVSIILDTKTHIPSSELSKIFCELDLDILNRPFDELLDFENKIFKEFQFVDWKTYKEKRVEVLKRFNIKNPNLDALIHYINNRKPNIGIYPGSFNPFHKGHLNILKKAEKIFDKVIIARGVNPNKEKSEWTLPLQINNRQIDQYNGMLTDYIDLLGYDVTVIRGLRNTTDLQYELTQYRFLQDMKEDIKVISIFCDNDFEHISSSSIREINKLGSKHASKYLIKNKL